MTSSIERGARSRAILWTAMGALVFGQAACSCADWEYQRAYHRAVEREVEAYRHRAPLDQLAREITSTLNDDGWSVAAPAPGDKSVSAWRADSDEARSRYHVQIDRDGSGFRVQLTREAQALSPQRWERVSSARDHDAEHAVLARVVPEAAGGVVASEAGDFVFDVPAHQLWTEVAAELAARGSYVTGDWAPVDADVHTEWVEEDGVRSRHAVRFVSEQHRQYRARITKETERPVGERRWLPSSRDRDIARELALIEQLDPAAHERITGAARAEAETAYRDAIDRGAPSCGGCGRSCAPPPG